MHVLGTSIQAVRLVSLLFGLGLLVALYGLGRELYDRRTAFLAVLVFMSFPYFTRLSAALSNDVQMTFFFALALWGGLRLRTRHSWGLVALAGCALGLGMLSKYVMVLILPIIAFTWWGQRADRDFTLRLVMVLAIAATLVAAWGLVAYCIDIFGLQDKTISGFAGSFFATVWG